MTGTKRLHVKIRAAQPSDIDVLTDLYLRSWNHSVRRLLPESALAQRTFAYRKKYWEEVFSRLKAPFIPFVIERDGRVIGLANLGRDRLQTDCGEVKNVYVDPTLLGQGLGRRLMAEAEKKLREAGFSKSLLWVLEGNDDGRRFYERLGWTPTGLRRLEEIDQTEHQLPVIQYQRLL